MIRKAIDLSKKRGPVIGKTIQIEVILVIVTKYGKKFLLLVHMSDLHIKHPLLLVVLHQKIKIINKLRTLHLQHKEYAVPKSSCTWSRVYHTR